MYYNIVYNVTQEFRKVLSTAARRRGNDVGYKSAYPNHPMTIWVGDTRDNFCWALQHAIELSKEYTLRYSKFHACQKIIDDIHKYYPDMSFANITEPPQCMPDEFKCDDFVRAYRDYYIHKIGDWKLPPKWFKSLDADPYYANV